MPSSFISHYTAELDQYTHPSSFRVSTDVQTSTRNVDTNTKLKLRSLLAALEQSSSRVVIEDAVNFLSKMNQDLLGPYATAIDFEEETLERAIMAKLVVAVYSEALDTFLSQCLEIEKEAEWWDRVERSPIQVGWYLLQTLPVRLRNVFLTITSALRSHNLPIRPAQFTPASLRRLFPHPGALRPSVLITALFPHLQHNPNAIMSQSFFSWSARQSTRGRWTTARLVESISITLSRVSRFISFPILLARQECHLRRKELHRLRNQKANILGQLSMQRSMLAGALEKEGVDAHRRIFYSHLRPFAATMGSVINDEPVIERPTSPIAQDAPSLLSTVQEIALFSLPMCNVNHIKDLKPLRRPPWLVRIWPRLLLLPPLGLYLIKTAYTSRTSLNQLVRETIETVRGFFVGWLLEPLKDVADTVRAKGDEGMIVHKEGVAADLESLERMALSLARDQLKYTPEQLNNLSAQIRVGDLTPVLKIYENDIKTPVKSAITGTLLRTLFIQVQKAKVDLDQALTGIDRLLKSQELTFAFVGVAPAIGILYLFAGYSSRVWNEGHGSGRYGGKQRRADVMFTLRRIERLLGIASESGANNVSPLTAGLLLLSLARLREYGNRFLPKRSRLRDGFLEDVEDLENPEFGRNEKRRVVDRMWRSWGKVLGWHQAAVQGEHIFN